MKKYILPVLASFLIVTFGYAVNLNGTPQELRELIVESLGGISNTTDLEPLTDDLTDGTQKSQIVGSTGNVAAVDTDGHLQVHNMNDGLSIAMGEVTGVTFIHKFGNAPDFDTGDLAVTIWDGADDGDINQMMYVYSSSTDIDTIVSSSASDTGEVEIQGLDGNYDIATQTATLFGQTSVSLDTPLFRVFRVKNIGSVDLVGKVYTYATSSITSGVPDDPRKVRAVTDDGNNQTEMAIYTIPAGTTGYMRSFFAATAGANKNSNYVIKLRARPLGGVFQLKHRTALADLGTSHFQHPYIEPEIFLEKTDIEMTVQVLASGVTAASVSAGFDIVLVDN